jgi:hypothetical protein
MKLFSENIAFLNVIDPKIPFFSELSSESLRDEAKAKRAKSPAGATPFFQWKI